MALDRSVKSFVGTNSEDGVVMGLDSTIPIGFYGATPVAQQTVSAAATDAGTTQTLANSLRTALIALGLVA
jgi:hypothetical protein